MNLSEIAAELAKQNPHIKPVETEWYVSVFVNTGKPDLMPSLNEPKGVQMERAETESKA